MRKCRMDKSDNGKEENRVAERQREEEESERRGD
jgi:hypothetical protein